jgi:hypothetical protein
VTVTRAVRRMNSKIIKNYTLKQEDMKLVASIGTPNIHLKKDVSEVTGVGNLNITDIFYIFDYSKKEI